MKTYNTIEDILNDHELMQLDVNELGKWLDSYLNNNSLTFFFKEYSMREAEWLKSEYERRQKEKPMKTYNTIEDIINDHELMAKSVEDIFNFIFDVSAELFKSMNGFYSEKTENL